MLPECYVLGFSRSRVHLFQRDHFILFTFLVVEQQILYLPEGLKRSVFCAEHVRSAVRFVCLVLQAYYYCAIVEDVILRFAWTIQISLTSMQIFPYAGDIISTVFAPLEVFR